MPDALITEQVGTTLIVRFNRPKIRSPLTIAVQSRIADIVANVTGRTVERIVFTGVGDVFASGADLREIAAVTPAAARDYAFRGQSLMCSIAGLPQVTIAAVNGFCFGGALDLAMACKYRIASPNALFSHPGASLGIITGWGGTQRLPRLVGEAAALEMLFLAKRVSADEALLSGLIDQIADDPLQAAITFQENS